MSRETFKMPRSYALLVAVGLLGLHSGFLSAAEPETANAFQLKQLFADDFSRDTRDQYEIAGDLQWRPGSITLAKGAKLTRTIDAGSWVEIECDLRHPQAKGQQSDSQTRLQVRMNGATDFLIVWDCNVQDGVAQHILYVFDTDPQAERGKQLKLVRRWRLSQFAEGRWRISYRYGAIAIAGPNAKPSERFVTSIDNGTATIQSATTYDLRSPLVIGSLSIAATAKPQPLNNEQRGEAEKAKLLNRQLVALYQSRNFSDAMKLAQQALEIRKNILGEEHPDYATSLNNLAGLYKSTGDYAQAEPLYRQALAIGKRFSAKSTRTTPAA